MACIVLCYANGDKSEQITQNQSGEKTMLSELLIVALIAVESSGNDFALGDKGKAAGCLQVHKCVIDDVNRIYGLTYQWPESAYSRETAICICQLYLKHYAKNYQKKTGRWATVDILCALWNAGPRGPWKLQTNERLKNYVKKIKREMDKNSIH